MSSMIFPGETPPSPIEEPPKREPARGALRRPFGAAALVVVLAALGGGVVAHFAWPPASTSSSASAPLFGFNPGLHRVTAPASSAVTSSAATRIDPGLVDINTVIANGEAAGTGMVVSSGGEVITNNHVISGATQISAYDIGNGRTYSARVVGYDRSQDVAIIQLEGASGLATVPLGDSSTLHVGASVVTIGNAGGVGGTPSSASGSVAALGRSITAGDSYQPGDSERLTGVIQIDGALEPGDSGGPLVSASKVVGMDTAASSNFSFQSSTAGQGFAIPINQVLTISRQILAGHDSSLVHVGPTALIGVYISNRGECTNAAGVSGSGSGAKGALVCGVVSGTPAAGTGLASSGVGNQYDTITSIGGKTVSSAAALLSLMDTHHPGDNVVLAWVDKAGSSHSATVRLTTGPAD